MLSKQTSIHTVFLEWHTLGEKDRRFPVATLYQSGTSPEIYSTLPGCTCVDLNNVRHFEVTKRTTDYIINYAKSSNQLQSVGSHNPKVHFSASC